MPVPSNDLDLRHMSLSFLFSVRFVAISDIVDHHCLNFLFKIDITDDITICVCLIVADL